ncbi:MAG: ZIP family metal transporter, partial [Candidatus Hodarchaeota archaeon]
MDNIVIALVLTTFAGLSTGIGSFAAFFVKKESNTFLSVGLGFSAGVMIAVSFIELLNESIEILGFIGANIAFFIGISAIFALDRLIPHEYIAERMLANANSNSNSRDSTELSEAPNCEQKGLIKVGLLTMVGIALHNFPEGLVTLAGTLGSIQIGLILAIAIAVHNIPEGISVALPIYRATCSRWQAFKLSFI